MTIWGVRVGRVKVAEKTPEGESWDKRGGLPDVYVELQGRNAIGRRTSVARDKLEHEFNELLRVVLHEGDVLRIRVRDEDPPFQGEEFFNAGEDDPIGTTFLTIEADDIKRGGLELKFGSVEYLGLKFEMERPKMRSAGDPRIK